MEGRLKVVLELSRHLMMQKWMLLFVGEKKGGLWLRQTPGYLARQVFLLSCRTAQCILLWFHILDLCTVVLG